MDPLKLLVIVGSTLVLSVASTKGQHQPNSTVSLTLNRGYGRAVFSSCRLVVDLPGTAGHALLQCGYPGKDGKGQPIPPLRVEEELGTAEANALLDLIRRSNLDKGDASGTDERSGDGEFDTLTVNNDGHVVVLVTTGNPSFVQFYPRRELLAHLLSIEKRLVDRGNR
jgi:hypothetical protein